jgi:hypothetical protein
MEPGGADPATRSDIFAEAAMKTLASNVNALGNSLTAIYVGAAATNISRQKRKVR